LELVFTFHSQGIEGLTKRDLAGVGLAVESLGAQLERLKGDMETDLMAVSKSIADGETGGGKS
jgi:hypothetical protein